MSDRTRGEAAIAVVIGRAGSKGLPGKNARMIAGQPMIAHSVRHALAANSINRVYCSTDGDSIARAAEEAGAMVVMRPAELADDHATVDSAVRHAVETTGDDAEIVVILYGNIPVRPEGLVDRAVEMLRSTNADSVQSYAPVGKHHPYWMMRMNSMDQVEPWQENTVYRRQDLPEALIPDGGVIAVRRKSLFAVDPDQPHAFLGNDRRGVRNGEGEVIDVDTEVDFRMAEALLETSDVPGGSRA